MPGLIITEHSLAIVLFFPWKGHRQLSVPRLWQRSVGSDWYLLQFLYEYSSKLSNQTGISQYTGHSLHWS